MPKISIIVPVYNSEQFVAETLDSLLGQTHADLEIICMDDGSHDGSHAILDAFAQRDKRVIVFSQQNQGVSIARNEALNHATGDIVMFVDADDTLLPNACELVASVFENEHPEVLTFGLACDPPEAAPASLRRELTPPCKTYNGFQSQLLFKDHARPYACRTALSRAFIDREDIRFEPGIALGEDQVFYFAVYPFSKKTMLIPDKLYIYRMNDASATHASTDGRQALLKKLDQHLMVIEAILRLWSKRDMKEFCAEELLEWCLDFTMLDIGKLPPADQQAVYSRLMSGLDAYFPQATERYAKRTPTKACLADIRHALSGETPAGAPVVANAHKTRYYLMRRGFIRCAERTLMKIGVVR